MDSDGKRAVALVSNPVQQIVYRLQPSIRDGPLPPRRSRLNGLGTRAEHRSPLHHEPLPARDRRRSMSDPFRRGHLRRQARPEEALDEEALGLRPADEHALHALDEPPAAGRRRPCSRPASRLSPRVVASARHFPLVLFEVFSVGSLGSGAEVWKARLIWSTRSAGHPARPSTVASTRGIAPMGA